MGDPNLANLRDTIKMGLSGVPWADALDGDVATRAVRQAFRTPGQAINMVLDNFRAKRAEAGVTSDAAVGEDPLQAGGTATPETAANPAA
ncbi:hypothetical protein ABTI04_19155, partial [Acinetobacter baumannii]